MRSRVSHRQDPWFAVLVLEVFIIERLSEDRLSTSAIVMSKVPTLKHEFRDYPMERGSLVAKAMLTSGKLAEVSSSLRDGVVIKFEDNPPGRLGVDSNIKKDVAFLGC